MNIGFYIDHCNERGVILSTFNYAKYNEIILGNKSIFLHENNLKIESPPMYHRIKEKFKIVKFDNIDNVKYYRR